MDRRVIATANQLFGARRFLGIIALVSDALDREPDSVPLLLMRARARIALHRDLDAQCDLREVVRLDPQCATAYRLLGELAARRDEHPSAAIFFKEALRLAPGDHEAAEWLAIVDRPARAAQPPPPIAAAGRLPTDDLERPTIPFTGRRARGSGRVERVAPDGRDGRDAGSAPVYYPPLTLAGARPLQRPHTRPRAAPARVEPPGFGDYLVATGILTRERLHAAQAYQRSMNVQLSTAIVTLGLATAQRIEWAAVAHESELARER